MTTTVGSIINSPRERLQGLRKELYYGSRALLRDNFACNALVARLQRNERLSQEELAQLQAKMVLRTLRAAAAKIPFYKGHAREIKKLSAPGAVDFLRTQLPLVTKEDLQSRRDLFYPYGGNLRAWTIIGRTSGTTGSPLEVVRSVQSVLWANAFKKRHWTWSGFREGMRRAMLRGDMAVPAEKTTLPVWFYNRYNRQLILSSRHLKPKFLPHLADALRQFSPHLLEAYPSTAYELGVYLEQSGQVVPIPYVYTGSEALYPHQRGVIERSFGATVMDHYGMAERVAYATECEYGNLHVNTDYSFVEIVDDAGRPTRDYGYIVGTTFHNLLMPLVRYQVSDMAKWKEGECRCGRCYPMIHPVTGKYEDMIWGSDGAPVSPSVITFAFKEMKHIRRSQVAQVGAGKWEIRLVADAGFAPETCARLSDTIKRLVDPQLEVTTLVVKDIPRTSVGKYKWIVNEWKDGARDKAPASTEQ